jgi:hypothetical protein
MPSSVTASFPTLKFTSQVCTPVSGGCSYDTCITVTESVDMIACDCVATQYDSSNQCQDWLEETATSKWLGYSGWFAIAEDQQTGLTCYDDENNEWASYSVTFRYYLVAKLVWFCCSCGGGNKGFWRLYARVYYSSACFDWPPGCGANPYPEDFTAAEANLDSWRCTGDPSDWPTGVGRITSTSACGTAGALPKNYYDYCSQTVCDPTGTYSGFGQSVTVS